MNKLGVCVKLQGNQSSLSTEWEGVCGGGEVGGRGGVPIPGGFMAHCKEFEFYPEWDGKLLDGLE